MEMNYCAVVLHRLFTWVMKLNQTIRRFEKDNIYVLTFDLESV